MSDLNSLIIFAHAVERQRLLEGGAPPQDADRSTVSRRRSPSSEQALGVRLIDRSTRSLRLTDVGSEVLEYARRGAA